MYHTVTNLLHEMDYSLQANRKTKEGAEHPERDAQSEPINPTVQAVQKRGQPVISVDAKKRELSGNFKPGGRQWHPQGKPSRVRVHDFKDPQLGRPSPRESTT